MAAIMETRPTLARDDRFFFTMAIIMALVLVAGFSLQLAAGRSSFSAPWQTHVHAVVFFGWTVLYVLQNGLVTTGNVRLHRRLGWVSLAWIPALVLIGSYTTTALIRRGAVPPIFTPAYFLAMDLIAVIAFAGLASASILLRRRTEWHRRLMFCAMAMLTGPGWGRLLPMPLLIPNAGLAAQAAILIFPAVAMIADLRRNGRVHPGLVWGTAVMLLSIGAMEAVGKTQVGVALYHKVAAGSRGAVVPPQAYPPLPPS